MTAKSIARALLVISGLLLPSVARAQSTVGVSYDALYRELDFNSHVGMHIDVSKAIGSAAAVAEFGINRFDDGTATSSYQGGFRYQPLLPGAPIRPFGQFLLGVWHCCGSTEFQIQPGVGVDFAVGAPFEVRIAYDYRRIFFDTAENAHRVSFGIVKAF